jgi:8-oxo-dGTP pyrophosphatase MutT (NUDIX family)
MSAPPARTTITSDEAKSIEILPPTAEDLEMPTLRVFSADALRTRFADTSRAWHHEALGDGQDEAWQLDAKQYREAAVLVPLVVRDSGITVLLTQRTATLSTHAGQVSFAGGRRDAEDVSIDATALREADEEIGLAAQHIEVIGHLPPYQTITRFQVTPVVALVHAPFTITPNAAEVADVFEVPLSFLTNPKNHQRRAREWQGKLRKFYAMPYLEANGKERFIWGATAGMLRNLYHFLRV